MLLGHRGQSLTFGFPCLVCTFCRFLFLYEKNKKTKKPPNFFLFLIVFFPYRCFAVVISKLSVVWNCRVSESVVD